MTMTTTDAHFETFCPGILEVLSIGKGDLTLSVGTSDDDRERAKTLIGEMLRKGYSIFVETDDGPVRVNEFNPRRMTYVIVDAPTSTPDQEPVVPSQSPSQKAKATRASRKREVPVAGSRATAVGRTAGG